MSSYYNAYSPASSYIPRSYTSTYRPPVISSRPSYTTPSTYYTSSLSRRYSASVPDIISTRRYSTSLPSSLSSAVEKDNKVSWKSKNEERSRVGLINLGNTCYMNAVLQCLCHTQPLVSYCVNESYRKDVNYSSPTRGDLIRVFAEFLKNVKESEGAVSPTQLRSQVQKLASRFSGSSQQDSQEFLKYFMQGLHEDVNRTKYGRKGEYGRDSWNSDSGDSIIVDLFAGQLKSSLKCSICNNDSITYDSFWDLSLPIQEGRGNVSLQQCLSLFSSPETLDGENKAFCEICKKKNRCNKKLEVHKFPKVLVIHLKRFSTSRYGQKLNGFIDCPLVLRNLSQFSSRHCYGSYDLYGVIDHIGTNNSGHYIAKCKDAKEWYEFDDSRVTKTTDIVTSNSYILFYIQD